MKRVNIILVGGFCGAGKTTSLVALAKYLTDSGKKIRIIANEPGSIAVDTEYMRTCGLEATEVSGGCFGSNYYKFAEKVNELCKKGDTDYILAEAAGCCTDLRATVMKPVRNGNNSCRLMPLSILIDPVLLMTEIISSGKHLPEDINYLMLKQMEEADILIINKSDILSRTEKVKIEAYLYEKFQEKKILFISAGKSTDIESWMAEIEGMSRSYHIRSKRSLEINYDIYTKAVTGMGFLELNCELLLKRKVQGAFLLNAIADAVKRNFRENNYELAHIKLCIKGSQSMARLNCTGIYRKNNIARSDYAPIENGILILQISAFIQAEQLCRIVEQVFDNIIVRDFRATADNKKIECFMFPLPEPVYRY